MNEKYLLKNKAFYISAIGFSALLFANFGAVSSVFAQAGASLTVTKVVVNDNGGTMQTQDFPLFVNGTQVVSGEQNGFDPGDYVVTETNSPGYTATFSGDCDSSGNVTLAAEDIKNCTITNDDIAPKLTVTKVVHNNYLGTEETQDFPLYVGETLVTSGVQNSFSAGVYTVSEGNGAGYTAAYSSDCTTGEGGGFVSLNIGDVKNCVITNSDLPVTAVKVIKHVINDNGGTKTAGDFSISVTDGTQEVFSTFPGSETGTVTELEGGTTYSVTEQVDPDYNAIYSEGCRGTIESLQIVTCTITNDDIAQNTGGGVVPVPFLQNPSPLPTNPTPPNNDSGNGGGTSGTPASTQQTTATTEETAQTSQSGVTQPTSEMPECTIYIVTPIRYGAKNDPENVKKLQVFLNQDLGLTLEVNGIYDLATFNAVKAFQLKHADEILKPWGLTKPTGYVYITTMRYINMQMCPGLDIPLPKLY